MDNKDILKEIFGGSGNEVNIIPVMNVENPGGDLREVDLPALLPILPLRNAILFPNTVIPVTVGRPKSIQLINDVFRSGRLLGAVTQMDAKVEDPSPADIYRIGTLGRVIKTIEMPDDTITAIIQGVRRFDIREINITAPYMMAEVTYRHEIIPAAGDADMDALTGSIKDAAIQIVKLSPNIPQEAGYAIKNIEGYDFIVNFIASSAEIDPPTDKVPLLEIDDLRERALKLLELLNKHIDLLKIKDDIQKKVKSEIDQQQREYYLNNQLKTIQEELGINSEEQDLTELRARAKEKKWSAKVAETFEKELRKLEHTNPNSSDYNVQYAYVDFLLELPWDELSEDNLDMKHAQQVLDEDHFGLEKVKDRIIEYLAVLKLKGDMKSPILCLYGPPGVGKTSLGKSIARALGRQYGRISLGGLHDESEIRGHRKTYVGALPGRIINAIHKAGSSNPVIVLDEIDKIGSDFKGDPSSALLEALDPEQNTAFHDNYLDVDYDLSKVLFITTANVTSTIQPALQDRMEMINVTGYLAEEKAQIASKFLIPKQLKEHGLKRGQLKIQADTISEIIDQYTHESGVRSLEKQIAKIARVTARKIATADKDRPTSIKPEHLREYLGLPTSFHDRQEGNEAPGVVTGLAWTPMGGEVLFVESSVSEGKGVLTTTGNLGDVMKESATIAYQYIKAHPALTGLSSEDFAKRDIHMHVPEGAVPKDGPSAGITMVTSMVSALRGKAIKKGIAMTGEMTLRGRVLPVGGIKEKILAAKRAGVSTIVISSENKKDIEDIKEIYIKGLNFVYVNTIDDVINYIF